MRLRNCVQCGELRLGRTKLLLSQALPDACRQQAHVGSPNARVHGVDTRGAALIREGQLKRRATFRRLHQVQEGLEIQRPRLVPRLCDAVGPRRAWCVMSTPATSRTSRLLDRGLQHADTAARETGTRDSPDLRLVRVPLVPARRTACLKISQRLDRKALQVLRHVEVDRRGLDAIRWEPPFPGARQSERLPHRARIWHVLCVAGLLHPACDQPATSRWAPGPGLPAPSPWWPH